MAGKKKAPIKEKVALPGGSSSEVNPFKEDDLSQLPKTTPMEEILKEEVEPTIQKATSVPSHLIQTKDEYNVEIIMDFDGKIDPFFLEHKDPKYKYRFLNEEGKNIAMKTSNLLFQKGGWQIVPRDHLVNVLKIPENLIHKDGVYRVGSEMVLARMPVELYEKKEEYKRKEVEDRTNRIKKLAEEGDSSLAGIGHENMKGLQPKNKLGDNWKTPERR